MTKLVLIDGNAIMHRAYHALPPLTTKSGEPINAVYGFVSILLRIINDIKPTHLVVCFDRPEKTFRKEKYVKYQAQRPVMDDFLSSQVTKMHDVLQAFSIPVYEKAGFEADDVIGTIARESQGKRIKEVIIITGDRDIFQLINDRVKVYVPVKGLKEGKLYGKKEVKEEFDFDPVQMVDYKALVEMRRIIIRSFEWSQDRPNLIKLQNR
jgi:DNA polymerase-1